MATLNQQMEDLLSPDDMMLQGMEQGTLKQAQENTKEFVKSVVKGSATAPVMAPVDVVDLGVISTGGHFGQYIDIDGDSAKNEVDLILKYRDIATQPECDAAVEDIINEAIVGDFSSAPIEIILDEVSEI